MNNPVSLVSIMDSAAVAQEVDALETAALWSFDFSDEQEHLPSAMVRWFKNQRFAPGTSALGGLCSGLAGCIAKMPEAAGCRYVCRALSSWETNPSRDAPLEVLAEKVASALGAEIIRPFKRIQPRRPMSALPFLGGSDLLARRIFTVALDLLVLPAEREPGRVLFLDDIACSGATAAVWSWSLREAGWAERVVPVNLASLIPGSPGLAVVEPEVEPVRAEAMASSGSEFFRLMWIDEDGTCHRTQSCDRLERGRPWWRGLAGRRGWCNRCKGPAGRAADAMRSLRGH